MAFIFQNPIVSRNYKRFLPPPPPRPTHYYYLSNGPLLLLRNFHRNKLTQYWRWFCSSAFAYKLDFSFVSHFHWRREKVIVLNKAVPSRLPTGEKKVRTGVLVSHECHRENSLCSARYFSLDIVMRTAMQPQKWNHEFFIIYLFCCPI